WAVLELTATGVIERLELDTTHFKGNYPDRFAIDVLHAPSVPSGELPDADGFGGWQELIPPTRTDPHFRHVFVVPHAPDATRLRLRVIPDGGVARLRAYGTITDDGWKRAGLRSLNALVPDAAERRLLTCCGSTA